MVFGVTMFAILWSAILGRVITLSLWCGLILLTLGLLLLARTRWGHARPLAKCAALSLFAHLLFCIYAYGTRIFVDHPMMPGAPTTQVSLTLDHADEQEPQEQAEREEVISEDQTVPDEWSQSLEEMFSDFPAAELERAELIEPTHEPAPLDDASSTTDMIAAELPLPAAEPTADEAPPDIEPPDTSNQSAVAAATPIETQPESTEAEPIAEVAPSEPAPPTAELQRQTIAEAAAADQLASSAVRETANAAAGDSPLQTLAEELFADDDSQAHVDEQDRNQSSGLAGDDTEFEGFEGTVPLEHSQTSTVAIGHTPAPAAAYRRPGDGAALPRAYQGRSAAQRAIQLQAMGGDAQTEEAVERALVWLAANQDEDGRWNAAAFGAGEERKVLGHHRGGAGARGDTGMTALAPLSFFGAGHTHFDGPYRKNVQHGLEFLLRSQRHDGSLSGDAELFAAMYCHGIAFLALSEAYAMTGDARLKPYVERAQQFTLTSQIPYDGGWRYQPGDSQGDMSQFGWQVMALRSAEVAGVPLPAKARQGMLRFLSSVTSGDHQGLASYRANTRPSRTMTAEAVTCRYFLDLNPSVELRREAADFLMEETPGAEPANFYYWYYGSLAMQQMQDDRWPQWNAALKQSLLSRQRTDGEFAGSWDPNTVWGGYGGRVYTTSMATMCLEVYYRYLPLYQNSVAQPPSSILRR